MSGEQKILRTIRAAWEEEPRINLHLHPIRTELDEGTLIAEGEVETVAAKKIALELAARVPGITGIADRLRVAPSTPMADGEIRNHLRDSLLQEPAFQYCGIRIQTDDRVEVMRKTEEEESAGTIEVRVQRGVVTLDGRLPSLSHKRLAGVLAWWVPGTRDVVNGIEVFPDEEDNDFEIADAVRLVLEKDPLIDARQIRVGARNRVVRLDGLVPYDRAREMAELDAWYVLGVDDVENRLEVQE